MKLEKIFQYRDKEIKTFSEYANKYKSNVHKVSSCDSMINVDLWIISMEEIKSEEPTNIENNNEMNKINNIIDHNLNTNNKRAEFQWNVELFTLSKLKIKNGAYYINKNIILTSRGFVNIIGCD